MRARTAITAGFLLFVVALLTGIGLISLDAIVVNSGAQSPEATCGDFTCDPATENCATCPSDCGICPGGEGAGEGYPEYGGMGGEPVGGGGIGEEGYPGYGGMGGGYEGSTGEGYGGGPSCGDFTCDPATENCATCPSDCGPCPGGEGTDEGYPGEGYGGGGMGEGPMGEGYGGGPSCGDGACRPGDGESCGTCPEDCGWCVPECGDGVCDSGLEDCSVCPEDCGGACLGSLMEGGGPERPSPFCGDGGCHADDGETSENCPADCFESLAGTCPDGQCDYFESCANCSEDCGVCAEAEERAGESMERQLQLPPGHPGTATPPSGADASARELTKDNAKEAVVRLSAAIEQDRSAMRRVPKGELRKMEELAERLEGGEQVGFREKNEIGRVATAIGAAVRDESQEMQSIMREIVLKNPSAQRLLRTLPGFSILSMAAESGDLNIAQALLPEPDEDLATISGRLAEIEAEFPEITAEPEPHATHPSFARKVFAQEPSTDIDPKERFKQSAFLMKRMREMAIDPGTGLPSLDERLEYLMDRKRVLAGVVGIAEEDIASDLQEVRKSARTPARKELIRLTGILRYIRTTANFEQLEGTLSRAARNMRSGLRRLIGWKASPRAEAAEILQEHAPAFTGEDIEAQRLEIATILREQETEFTELLETLDDGGEKAFRERMEQWRLSLESAQTPVDMRRATEELTALLREAEVSARSGKNIVLRLGYAIQDFFGLGS